MEVRILRNRRYPLGESTVDSAAFFVLVHPWYRDSAPEVKADAMS